MVRVTDSRIAVWHCYEMRDGRPRHTVFTKVFLFFFDPFPVLRLLLLPPPPRLKHQTPNVTTVVTMPKEGRREGVCVR